jgi:hypothetical protein
MINHISHGMQFMHVVMFSQDEDVFALAREDATRKIHLFLIIGDKEQIYQRDVRTNCWERLDQEDLSRILQSICHEVNNGLTVLKIDGTASNFINSNN